jgi:hypothetical protein
MADNDLTKACRLALRLESTSTDDQIQDLIDAARIDLNLAGATAESVAGPDKLVRQAIVSYVMAHWGLDDADAARAEACYDRLNLKLALSTEYGEGSPS